VDSASSPEMKSLVDELKELLMDKLYHHYRVLRMWNKAERIINDLFNVYLQEPNQLSPDVYPTEGCSEKEKYHIICNYIAGMTDRSALDEHKRFFNAYTKV
jgi:dGTPase